jgi:hypothetical protein
MVQAFGASTWMFLAFIGSVLAGFRSYQDTRRSIQHFRAPPLNAEARGA